MDTRVGDEASFVVEDVQNILKESIENVLQNAVYQHPKVNEWSNQIMEFSLKKLTLLNKPFKYIVTCVIMQKNGAGVHTASSCFWDNTSDGSCAVKWENKTIYCICSVFGVAI